MALDRLPAEVSVFRSKLPSTLTRKELDRDHSVMRATPTLLRQCVRLTFFTRPNCTLCDEAKLVVNKVWKRRPFEYDEIDVMAPKQDKWKALYEFDTPVVRSSFPRL